MLTMARRAEPVSVMMTWTISPGLSVIGSAVSAWALSKTVSRSAAGSSVARQMPFSVRPVSSSKRTIRSLTGRPPSNTTTSSCAGSTTASCDAFATAWAWTSGVIAMPATMSSRPSSRPARVRKESFMGSTAHPGAFGALLHGPAKFDGSAEQVAAGELLEMLLGPLEVTRLEQRISQRVADVLVAQQADAGQVLLHAGGLLEAVELEEDRQALLEFFRLVDDPGVERKRLDQPAGALVQLGCVRSQAVVVERGGSHHVGGGQLAPLVEVDVRQDLAQHHVVGRGKSGLFENDRGLLVLPGLAQRIADGDRIVACGGPACQEFQTLVGRFLVKPLVDEQKHLPAGEIAGAFREFDAALPQDAPGLGVIFELPISLGAHQEYGGHARVLGPGIVQCIKGLVVAMLAEIRLRQVQPDDRLVLACGEGVLEFRGGQRQFVEVQCDQARQRVITGQVDVFGRGIDPGQDVARALVVAVADQHGGQRQEFDRFPGLFRLGLVC